MRPLLPSRGLLSRAARRSLRAGTNGFDPVSPRARVLASSCAINTHATGRLSIYLSLPPSCRAFFLAHCPDALALSLARPRYTFFFISSARRARIFPRREAIFARGNVFFEPRRAIFGAARGVWICRGWRRSRE